MEGVWLVVVLALLPALGNFSGGLAAEATRTTWRRLNYALHAASGLVMAVIAVEMPASIRSNSHLHYGLLTPRVIRARYNKLPSEPIAAASLGQVYKARLEGQAWVAVM